MRSSPSSVVGQFCHISPLTADVAAPSQMQGLNAIVLETHIAILIIDRRCYQRIGYRHTPMCPSWVVTVVVVVVGSSGLTYYRICKPCSGPLILVVWRYSITIPLMACLWLDLYSTPHKPSQPLSLAMAEKSSNDCPDRR